MPPFTILRAQRLFDGSGDPATVAKEMQQAVENAKGG